MINQVNSQPLLSCPLMNMPKQEAKNLIISPSLMMMLLEWASKQGENDIALHQALENMMSFNDGINPLKMECFKIIVDETIDGTEPCCHPVEAVSAPKECDDENKEDAFKLGSDLADTGADLSSVPYSEVAPMIIQNRDDKELEGCGASNAEIESFWDGYESVEPQEIEYKEEIIQPCVQSCEQPCNDCCEEPCKKEIKLDITSENNKKDEEDIWNGYDTVEIADDVEGWSIKPVEVVKEEPKKEISDDLQAEIDRIINLSAGM